MAAFQSIAEIERLASEFEKCTLPRDRWTHSAHLAIAIWYMTRHVPDEAIRHIRDGIQAYNHAQGIANTETGGYHETITLFYIHVVRKFLCETDPNTPLPDLFKGLIRDYGHKRLLAQYYSRPRLFSQKARTEWVAPDLRPLG